jgi:nucleoside-diphosphate-sugar epimerase
MKILITGGGGHVGGAIRRHLDSLGWETADVSRSGTIRADMSSPDFAECVAATVKQCDAIVHCAASLAKGLTDLSISQVNCIGTQQVIRVATLTGALRLVYISGVPVVGRPQHLPVDEEHPTAPLTAYHASKLFGEHLVRIAHGPALKTASLRITSPVGPATPPGRIFSEFIRRARCGEPLILAGQGGRRQNYVDVRDVAQAVVQCLQSEASGVFNVAGAAAVSNLDLARLCIKALESPSPVGFSGTSDPEENIVWDVSIEKARRSFGYQPVHSLEDSIQTFVSAHESGHHQ